MKKIIFLDHDGVICYGDNWATRFNKQVGGYKNASKFDINHPDVKLRFDDFNQDSVSVLNEILTETNADIVVSSDWKLYATLDEMGDYYESQGIIKRPVDFTPNWENPGFREPTRDLIREKEIRMWLNDNPDVTTYVAIDDLNLYGLGSQHFVYCDIIVEEGLEEKGIKQKILELLK